MRYIKKVKKFDEDTNLKKAYKREGSWWLRSNCFNLKIKKEIVNSLLLPYLEDNLQIRAIDVWLKQVNWWSGKESWLSQAY